MYVRNLLNSGDYVIPIPEGLFITLQYDSKGNLQKVYQGYHEHLRTNITDAVLTTLYDSRVVPTSIPLQGGTTWVAGVLYTNMSWWAPGQLPDCIAVDVQHDFVTNPSSFTFHAGTVYSLAASFLGRPAIQNWLQIAKFNNMYGFVVPYKFDRNVLETILNSAKSAYSLKKITSYLIFRNGDTICSPANTSQFVVTKVSKHLEPDGRIMAKVYGHPDNPLVVNYSDAVKFNLQVNTGVVLDESNHIVYAESIDNKPRDKRLSVFNCSCCGAPVEVPTSGDTICSNLHCPSTMYPRVQQLLETLNAPVIPYETFWKYVTNNMITTLSDVFLLPEYVNYKVDITWSRLLSAVVPFDVVPDPSIFATFAGKCKNAFKTINYYLHNPALIQDELGMKDPNSFKFAKWLTDGSNLLLIESVADCPNITLTATNRAFDGAPIFRNQVIYLTGKFTHGSLDKIESILRSYGADVQYDLSETTTWVLVGDIPEDINSGAVRKARKQRLVVFTESSFFHEFEIDSDLVSIGVANL